MTQQAIYRLAALIGLLWIAGQAVFQVTVASAPSPAFYWLNGANLVQVVAVVSAVALLLVTNTRRPKGIDPDAEPLKPEQLPQTRESRERSIVAYDAKGRPYGRRAEDVNPDHVGVVLAALRNLPEEARSSLLGLGVVTDPAELKMLHEGEDDQESDWTERPDWAEDMLKHKDAPELNREKER